MKLKFTLIIILLNKLLFAQLSFTEVPQAIPFTNVLAGDIAFADIDNDGDEDVLISGFTAGVFATTNLYKSNGKGSFTKVAFTEIDGAGYSSIAFADIDSDGDEDLLIAGEDVLENPSTNLYINDGTGGFEKLENTAFEDLMFGDVAFADIDNDGDDDLLITGRNYLEDANTKLYENLGAGNFAEIADTPFENVKGSTIAFADVDNDNDKDVLIIGENNTDDLIAELYLNDGNGAFTETTGTPFTGLNAGDIAFTDVDNDGDLDVMITGASTSFLGLFAKMYLNDGLGNFTEKEDLPFEGVFFSKIKFEDIDNDGDDDLLLTGNEDFEDNNEPVTKLYTNDGLGNFTEITGTIFEGIYWGAVAFADVDSDNDMDVLITGERGNLEDFLDPHVQLYFNDGKGNYSEAEGTPFEGIEYSAIAFADVDGDDDEDVLITGQVGSYYEVSNLYINDGKGSFTQNYNVPFEGVEEGAVAFADINNDGDKDLLITGIDENYQNVAKLYENDGTGNFTEVEDTTLTKVYESAVAFADVDGDGDEDLLITGDMDWGDPSSKLYFNDGNGNYTESADTTTFEKVRHGSVNFADVDGDDDNDVLITGVNIDFVEVADLYINDGNGNFAKADDTPFQGVALSSVAFADVDNDGDQDVHITGDSTGWDDPTSKMYINDGLGNFTEATNTLLEGVLRGSLAFADVENDGDLDLLVTGRNSTEELIAKLYINDGTGNFTEVIDSLFECIYNGSIAFANINGDNLVDLLITGINKDNTPITKLYINDGILSSIHQTATVSQQAFTVYPNPVSSDKIFVNAAFNKGGLLNINVFDLNGRLMQQQQQFSVAGKQTLEVNITTLPKGNYLLHLEANDVKGIQKFILH